MQNPALLISILTGAAIFFLIIFIAAWQYGKTIKKMRYGKADPNDWLFHHFNLKVYSALFGNRDADEVAVKLGIDIEKYYASCALTKTAPEVKKLVVHQVYGIAIFILSIPLSLFVSLYFCIIGAALFFFLVFYEQQKLNKKADAMRIQIANELPRFLDLLQTELQVGLSIENAIYILCERFHCLLSREFLEALNEMKLGIGGWQQALEQVAAKYNVETLSDFVLDVSTSYTKGVSITESVMRKNREVKETHLLNIKERAGKATNTMLIPITIFQLLPMIGFLMLPTLSQILSASSF